MPALNLRKTYQKYPEYKDSKSDWVGVIPKNWNIKRNRFLSTYIKGKNVDFCNSSEKGCLPYLTAEVIRGTAEPEYCFGDIIIKEKQLLLLWDGANAGEFFWAGPGVVSSTFSLITSNKEIYPRFYYWVSKSFEKKLRDYTQGMGIPHVSPSIFKDSHFPEIPTSEQKIISDFLDTKTNLTNQIIEKKQKLITLLQEKRSALITHAVTKGLDPKVKMKQSGIDLIGEIPENWKTEKLKYIVTERNTKTENLKTGDKYLGMENIESKTGRLIESQEEIIPESSANIIINGDVLFGKLRPYLAKVFVVKQNGIASGEMLDLKPNKNKIISDFLFYCMLNQEFIETVNNSTYGAKMPRASWNFIGNIQISYPNLESQLTICNHLSEKTKFIDQSILSIKQQMELLSEYRSSLIYHTVTGKIKI